MSKVIKCDVCGKDMTAESDTMHANARTKIEGGAEVWIEVHIADNSPGEDICEACVVDALAAEYREASHD